MPTTKIANRRIAIKRPREGDTGHVIQGIGFSFECSCGERGKVRRSWNAAVADGRQHAASHTEQDDAA